MTHSDADTTKKVAKYENGILTLSDGSKWKVPPIGKTFVGRWEVRDNVIVGSGFIQKYKITHPVRDESIEVELIEEAPIGEAPIEEDSFVEEPFEEELLDEEQVP